PRRVLPIGWHPRRSTPRAGPTPDGPAVAARRADPSPAALAPPSARLTANQACTRGCIFPSTCIYLDMRTPRCWVEVRMATEQTESIAPLDGLEPLGGFEPLDGVASLHGFEPLESFERLVGTLRAIAEPTRLRLVVLLARAELTVTEISQVIGQSQPRTSRHLRLLLDADILERSPEGAFVFYRLADRGQPAELVRAVANRCAADDPVIAVDLAALERVRHARSEAAAAYLGLYAEESAAIRSLHVAETDVERDMLELIAGEGPIKRLLDIGTGTGRILELMAPHSERSIGLDLSHEMLQLARANLDEARLSRASVRPGDLHRPPLEAASFDVGVMDPVLHS